MNLSRSTTTERLHEQPRLPNSVIKVLALARLSTTAPQEIERHVESDPGLRSTMLKLANSVVFCLNRRVDSIREAVVVLGMSRIQALALCYGFAGILRKDMRALGFTKGGLLEHSIAVAVSARALAARVWSDHRKVTHLFMAGMVHELPQVYRVVSASNGESWTGGDPAERAIAALRDWHVEPDVVEIVRNQRASVEHSELRRQVAALRIAEAVAAKSEIGMQPEAAFAALHEGDLECLFLKDPGVWEPLFDSMVADLEVTVTGFSSLIAA